MKNIVIGILLILATSKIVLSITLYERCFTEMCRMGQEIDECEYTEFHHCPEGYYYHGTPVWCDKYGGETIDLKEDEGCGHNRGGTICLKEKNGKCTRDTLTYRYSKILKNWENVKEDDCKELSNFLENNNIDYDINLECLKRNEIIKSLKIETDEELPQIIIDEIGNSYREIETLKINAAFVDEKINFDSIRHLSNLTTLKIYNKNSNKKVQLRDEFFPTGICKATKLESISFNGFAFKSFPKRFSDLTYLQELDLSYNEISDLPNRIGDLTKLVKLNMSNNKIPTIPSRIGDLKKLEYLDLSVNEISSLPKRISDLTHLKELNLNNNKIEVLPNRIGDLTVLTSLSMTDNKITSIPGRIGDLKKLKYLNLGSNEINSITSRFGELENLEELHLEYNKISIIPKSFELLANVTKIDLTGNQLDYLPKQIKSLQSHCQICLIGNPIIDRIENDDVYTNC